MIDNKDKKTQFFEETFLLADINMNVALKMFFLTLSSIKINLTNLKLKWRSYIIAKIPSTTRLVKLIWKIEFEATTLNRDYEIFIVYIASLTSSNLNLEVHYFCRAQIAFLKAYKVIISIFSEYTDFTNVFSKNLIAKLPKYTKINNYAINLVEGQQPPYKSIYGLRPIKLET